MQQLAVAQHCSSKRLTRPATGSPLSKIRAQEATTTPPGVLQPRTKLSTSARPFEPMFNVPLSPTMVTDMSAQIPAPVPAKVVAPEAQVSAHVEKLCASEGSWMAQQKARRKAAQIEEGHESARDAEIMRTMKSILNKLTVEKFDQLSEKLLSCGIGTASHLEALMNEIFEKATTQHCFIGLYGDLCLRLQSHFTQEPITGDPKMFKSVLLKTCQTFFERHSTVPAASESVDEGKRKIQMIGNMKFVGALLVRQLLATKLMVGMVEALFAGGSPLMLELLAVLLTAIGPSFDTPEWKGRAFFADVFGRLSVLSTQANINARVRCLLKDVLELRAAGWQQRLPKKVEGPSTLKEVADTFAAEEAASSASPIAAHGAFNRRAQGNLASGSRAWRSSGSEKAADAQTSRQSSKPHRFENGFDEERCRRKLSETFDGLRKSRNVNEASARVAALAVPASFQREAVAVVLAKVAEESLQVVRKTLLELLVRLLMEDTWQPCSLGKGLKSFVDLCAEVKIVVPGELYRHLR